MTKKETIIVLFSITLCWSSSYIFIKDLSSAFSAYAYLTLTSGFAGIGLALAFRHLIKKLDKKTILYGSVLALLIAGNIIFEKLALDNLPSSAVWPLASSLATVWKYSLDPGMRCLAPASSTTTSSSR